VSNDRLSLIRNALEVLQPLQLELQDESHKHAGHQGARDGRGHFSLYIVSKQFVGLSPMQRHKLVYGALGDLLKTDIHALAIQAKTPDEAEIHVNTR
jgi:BolA family transcriptional regulator, general stress-responsive regulator